jgi:thiosulfate/3-mercaptopyruvate sulfurtransferase
MFKQTLLALVIGLAYAAPAVRAADKPTAMRTEARIIDTAGVQAAIERGAIVWDVRNADDYNKGHIPGAVNIGDVGKVLRKDATEDYVPLAEMEKVLGDAGIDPRKEIVVYGDKGNPFVYFGLFTVEYLNGKQGRIYHGGIDDWKAAGNPVSAESAKATPAVLKLTTNPAVAVSTKEVIAALKRKGVQIVDVRTPGEYSGDDIRAIRGGHIPGAVNIAYEQNWVDPDTPAKLAKKQVANKDGLALKPAEKLKALYAKLDPAKETIVYCQSGVRASETATVLKDLGFRNVKVYDSSWLGYGNTLDAPADNVEFFNVGALNGKLAAMQKRIDTLEKALADSAKSALK